MAKRTGRADSAGGRLEVLKDKAERLKLRR
jgi:hypothetical protein